VTQRYGDWIVHSTFAAAAREPREEVGPAARVEDGCGIAHAEDEVVLVARGFKQPTEGVELASMEVLRVGRARRMLDDRLNRSDVRPILFARGVSRLECLVELAGVVAADT